MRLVWSLLADRQVDEALAYIADDDVAAAQRWLEELLERVGALRRFPESGRVVPELGREEIRELLVGSQSSQRIRRQQGRGSEHQLAARSRSLWSPSRMRSSPNAKSALSS